MSRIDEQLTEQFHRWELRGRGWGVFEQSVELEPPFVPFPGYSLPRAGVDEGRRHTRVSGFLNRLQRTVAPPPLPAPPAEPEPEPTLRDAEELMEFTLLLPLSRSVPAAQVESFLRQVSRGSEMLALELLGTERETTCQLVASPRTAARVSRAVEACFPGIGCVPHGSSTDTGDALSSAWSESEQSFAIVELGLAAEWMLPLANPRSDVLAAVVAAMDGIGKEEMGLLQILFTPARFAWVESAVAALSDPEGQSLFRNRPDLATGARQKMDAPLFAVVIRLVACAADAARAWEIVADLAAPLSAFARPGGNFFVPLDNENYPPAAHEEDVLARVSRRSGLLLNLEELIPLLTPPVAATSRKLLRETQRTHPVPEHLRAGGSLCLGWNRHVGATHEVWLTPEHRVRHMHLVGASGTGKSTLLFNLLRQDIEQGQGVALLDPHGDLVDRVLGIIPPERLDDVVLVDPSDEEHVVGFNILAAHSDFERNLLASDLVSVFRRLSTSWGEQMNSVLRNAILAFLESSRGGTLADLRQFLLDAAFRQEFLSTVTDPEIVYYWTKAFPQLTGGKSVGPVLTRLDEFLSRKPIRYMVSQQENRLDFGEILDHGKILLVKLAQGQLGRENANLLGSVIVSKIQQMAMSRQRMQESERRDFWVYLDEFHSFITPSMAEILAGARKYRVGLVLAHQELHQLDADRDVASAVLANCGTRIVFRVSDRDARELDSGFAHFAAADLQNLPDYQAVCRVGRSEADFNVLIPAPDPDDERDAAATREAAIRSSHARYARPRSEVEAELSRKREAPPPGPRMPMAESASLKASEAATVPEPTVEPGAGMRADSATAPRVEEPPANPKPLPEFGRGGPEHRAIQQDVKASAEKLGFHAEPEKEVLGGAGIVDVSLERDGQRIACEISVTTPSVYETAKFQMCLAAGYEAVIAIGPEKESVIAMAKAIQTKLTAEEASRIHVCLPHRFPSVLKRLARRVKRSEDSGLRSGSYKIKRKYSAQSPDKPAQAGEDEFLRAVRRALRGE